MSPRSSRRRQPQGRRARHRKPPPEAIFQGMLRTARELLAVRSPLDAELIISEMLGAWWGQRLVDADVEEVIGESLVDHAARAASPAALALLTGVAYLGTSRQAALAEQAALELMEQGVARPAWADRVGMVSPTDCYASRDVYGDQDSIICVFTYGGEERHALVVVVDYNVHAMMRDAWVSSQVDRLLEHCRAEATDDPLMRFDQLEPGRTRVLLEDALQATDDADDPPVAESFGSYHAFARARIRALPPGGRRPATATYSRDRRATIAAEFLASDEAEDLSDRSAASTCVDRIIDYGCDRDFGRPLRISPVKCERFLLDWLPRKVMLSPTEQDAMPHVLTAWVRWACKRSKLPDEGMRRTLDALWDATGKFAGAYRDPTTFGLTREFVERLLPDGDLEALPRRAFAFPFLEGTQDGIDLASLDPADPADRRRLIEFEHLEGTWSKQHMSRHERLADRLWNGSPPQLWTAAQWLLDDGQDRHEVLHQLMDVVADSGDDTEALRSALRDLRDEPGKH